MDLIPEQTLALAVVGTRIAGHTLADVLGDSPTLVVFLRHFG